MRGKNKRRSLSVVEQGGISREIVEVLRQSLEYLPRVLSATMSCGGIMQPDKHDLEL